MNTNKSFPCVPVLTEEDIEWLEFGMEEWVDALELLVVDGERGRTLATCSSLAKVTSVRMLPE